MQEPRNHTVTAPRASGMSSPGYAPVGFFGVTIAFCFCLFHYLSRLGMGENRIGPLAVTFGAGCLLACAPLLTEWSAAFDGNRKSEKWYSSGQSVALMSLVFMVLLGYVSRLFDVDLSHVISFLGVFLFIAAVVKAGKRKGPFSNRAVYAVWVLFSIWLVCVYWGFEYYSPLFREKIISGAYAHRDTLFHGSISGMIGTYGIPATGLDGVVDLHYHVLSHYVYSFLSRLLELDVITFYNLGLPVIIIPLFFYGFITLVRELTGLFGGRYEDHRSSDEKDIKYWLLFSLLFLHLIPYKVRYGLRNIGTDYSYILSPSYMLALTVTFIAFGLLLRNINDQSRGGRDAKQGVVFLVITVPLLYLTISMVKLSFLYLLGCMYGYLFIRLRLFRYKRYIVSAIACVLVCAFVFKTEISYLLAGGGEGEGISLNISPFRIVDYFFDCAAAMVYLGLRIHAHRLWSFHGMMRAVREGSTIDIEILIFMVLVSFFPNYPYFQDFQNFMAYALIMANYNDFYHRLFGRGECRGARVLAS